LQNDSTSNILHGAPVDAVVFDLMKQWVKQPEKQFVFGVLEDGYVNLVIPDHSSNVTSVFRELAVGASTSAEVNQAACVFPTSSSLSVASGITI